MIFICKVYVGVYRDCIGLYQVFVRVCRVYCGVYRFQGQIAPLLLGGSGYYSGLDNS